MNSVRSIFLIPLVAICFVNILSAQSLIINERNFFEEEKPLKMILEADFSVLQFAKYDSTNLDYTPCKATIWLNDSSSFITHIAIRPRGSFRRMECNLPPLMISFSSDSSSPLRKLGKLKFVWTCNEGHQSEQWVMKEYLTYKIYNDLTDFSFRVRAVKVEFRDIHRKIKPIHSFAFFIEDLDDVAKRTHCVPYKKTIYHTEQTNRSQMTVLALFEYMIGNTDWAVPLNRNIKLVSPAKDSLSLAYAVPYDFDYCGLVDAAYALPPAELPISTVKERLYRGFKRSEEELQNAFSVFDLHYNDIQKRIVNFEGLDERNKHAMTSYIHSFYKIIHDPVLAKRAFINGARR